MNVDFRGYLIGLEFLIHRHIAKEVEKLGENLSSIKLLDPNDQDKGVMGVLNGISN
jgi:hypothetical protein